MNSILSDADAYIELLRKRFQFSLSLHPQRADTLIYRSPLLRFNLHCNPYCLYLKTCPELWRKCVAKQEKVCARCADGAFFGMCFAGTEEFVYPVFTRGELACFISVSGYRSRAEGCQRAASAAKQFGLKEDTVLQMYEQGLRTDIPPRADMDALIQPLVRMLEYAYARVPEPQAQTRSGELYQQLLHYLHMHYTEQLSIPQIAARFHYSTSTVSHLFKARSGLSIPEYMNRLRIDAAAELLGHTHTPVSAAASITGFADPDYFSAVFRKQMGVSPSQYAHTKMDRQPED